MGPSKSSTFGVRLLSAIAFALLTSAFTPSLAQASCLDFFAGRPVQYFPAHGGERVSSKEIPGELAPFLSPDTKVFLLGKGEANEGKVFRLVESDGRRRTIKLFKDEGEKISDLRRLGMLREIARILSANGQKSFRVIEASDLGYRLMELESVFGQPLHKVLSENSPLPISKRSELHQDYLSLLENIKTFMKKQGLYIENEKDINFWIAFRDPRKGSQEGFMLHTGNVLVDPRTLELIIIDPI